MQRRLVFLIVVGALIAFLFYQFPYALSRSDDKMRLTYLSILLIVLSGSALSTHRLPLGETLRYGLIWLIVILVLLGGYSYRDEIMDSRIAGELLPNRARTSANGGFTFTASQDGHFYIEARVNGVPVNFMVDTGASDVMLTKEDAARIGFNPDTLSYSRTYMTANGATGGATVRLNRLELGTHQLDDFPASVNSGDLGTSLLGMSALCRLGGFSIEGNQMTIGSRKTP